MDTLSPTSSSSKCSGRYNTFVRAATALMILCGISLAMILHQYRSVRIQAVADAKMRARQEILRARDQIEAVLGRVMAPTHELVAYMDTAFRTPEDIVSKIESIARANPLLRGVGIAYAPEAPDPGFLSPYFAPYLVRVGANLERRDLVRDYRKDPFFKLPMEQRKPTWQEPHYGIATEEWIANYTAPFFGPDGIEGIDEPVGVVFTSLAVEDYQNIIDHLILGRTGYGFLLSKKGAFIAHPSKDYVESKRTIMDLAIEQDQAFLALIGARSTDSNPDHVDYIDALSGQPTWMFHQPIRNAEWTLGAVFIKTQFMANRALERRWQPYIIVLATFIALLFVSVLASLCRQLWIHIDWILVVTVAAILLVCAILLLYIGRSYGHTWLKDTITLLDRHETNRTIQLFAETIRRNRKPALTYIPTGVYVQSVQITSTDILISGYIWQRYPRDWQDVRDVILPDAISLEMMPVYEYASDSSIVVGWHFVAELQQNYHNRLYPFGEEVIQLRIWHADPTQDVIVVPDLAAYSITNPRSLPGIAPDCTTPGWTPIHSFFGIREQRRKTNFGVENQGEQKTTELFFAVAMQRQIGHIVVSQIVPLTVVCASLFALLLSITTSEKKSGVTGFNFVSIIGATSALFFVLVLSHASLSQEVARESLIETIYFIVYFMMLWVSANATWVMARTEKIHALIRYRDNLLAKLLYWPMLMFFVCCAVWAHLM